MAPDRVGGTAVIARLTSAERRALTLLSQGRTGQQVADSLGVSLSTVRRLIETARVKTGARNRVQVVAVAVREGFIP